MVKHVNASSFLVLGVTSSVLFGFQNCSQYKAAQSQSATYSQVLDGSSTADSGGGAGTDAQGALIGLDSGTPVDIVGLNGILDLFSGPTHSCGQDLLGRTSCWGSNGHGQFGNGTATWSPTPRDSPGLYNLRQVVGGYQTSAGISAGGHLKVWGVISNSIGRTSVTVPTP